MEKGRSLLNNKKHTLKEPRIQLLMIDDKLNHVFSLLSFSSVSVNSGTLYLELLKSCSTLPSTTFFSSPSSLSLFGLGCGTPEVGAKLAAASSDCVWCPRFRPSLAGSLISCLGFAIKRPRLALSFAHKSSGSGLETLERQCVREERGKTLFKLADNTWMGCLE